MTSPAANRRSELRAARQARVCPPAPRGLRRTSTPDLRRFRCRPPAALQASPGRRDGHPPPAQERLPPGALAAAVPEDTGAAPGPAGQPGSLRLSGASRGGGRGVGRGAPGGSAARVRSGLVRRLASATRRAACGAEGGPST
ncbi:DNA polymerase nu [Manis javanica]|nr:DNA polymerase nu [Manis javanica]